MASCLLRDYIGKGVGNLEDILNDVVSCEDIAYLSDDDFSKVYDGYLSVKGNITKSEVVCCLELRRYICGLSNLSLLTKYDSNYRRVSPITVKDGSVGILLNYVDSNQEEYDVYCEMILDYSRRSVVIQTTPIDSNDRYLPYVMYSIISGLGRIAELSYFNSRKR